jgi:ATP-dependent helicase HrpB
MELPRSGLPIEDVIAPLLAALAKGGVCVLQAPPGAGKTTRVPLEMLAAGAFEGRVLMLEPRRLAARAAAERMAESLGEDVGETVGYRMRGEAKTSKTTRIEVVTEGILTRMIQSDPSLAGIGAVIFDEFHERSLNGDLGLALVWEARAALREDLKVVVMSATLDAGPVAALLGGAPVVTSDGRAFKVETRWLERPIKPAARVFERRRQFITQVCGLIERALDETEGGVLVFLPGEGEIRAVASSLSVPEGVVVQPLFGALPFREQRAAVRPLNDGRKLVLATSIAETSLTIEDVRVVVDAGRARRARFDPGSGMSRLVTEKVSRAEADQRRGRAGRVAEGVCYRMWTRAEEGALPGFPPAEIEAADLSALVLELAAWGAAPEDLAFLSPPPEGAYTEAQDLLRQLGALDASDRITDHGRALAAMPVHPRLAHMLAHSGSDAAGLAAILGARDPLGRAAGSDVAARVSALSGRAPEGAHRATLDQLRAEAKRLARHAGEAPRSVGEMAALAYPDRIGLRRAGDDARFVLSGGKGAVLANEDALAGEKFIVALDLDGDGREAKIRLAARLSEADLRGLYGAQISWEQSCAWSRRDARVSAVERERLGALVLSERVWKDADPIDVTAALLDGLRELGLGALGWSKAAKLLRARVRFLADQGADMPDWSDTALLANLQDWLAPYLSGLRSAQDLRGFDPFAALRDSLSWEAREALDRLAPAKFTTPLGREIALDYTQGTPEIALRLQEMFGVTSHPTVGPARLALKVTLLSPAGRPVQVTDDLPGFWTSSYADVRKDMRARYPKHPWPEDPSVADPTLRAKPR